MKRTLTLAVAVLLALTLLAGCDGGTSELVEIDLTSQGIDDAKLAQLVESGDIPGNVTTLWLDDNEITEISVLAGLTSLTELDLSENEIGDIGALAGLTNLTALGLESAGISDISLLAGLTNLTKLFLSANQISDVSILAGLTKLTWLGLDSAGISDISPLAGLTKLVELGLDSISDISALAGLKKLEYLALGGDKFPNWYTVKGKIKDFIKYWEEENEQTTAIEQLREPA